ncbi:hypothetical protein D9756_007922 [Leucocoprinus leucothites]|uniref:OTU domain-containing protein n=1 Tax=Leucocoprinus leucothites TaxID=201217 RepID=A0A8H5D688_9AGAR|nr:hypothetical protein D9756_007922 [Leucoagaricus leucothites]
MGHGKRRHNPQLKARTTRSSRGRLLSLSDPAQNSQLLDNQLRQLGLYAAPTLGDGNCLFRALSDQLYGTDSKHAQLRQDICDWIYKHKSRYEPFVEDERGIDTHLRCMRENATYGGHMELSAFAHMAKRNVKVVQPGLVYVIEWQAFVVSQSPTTSEPPNNAQVGNGGASGSGGSGSSPRFPDKEFPDVDHQNHSDLDDDHDDDANSTIYVAYHDWEHFSSIRNLKGPHAGPPHVKERPPPATTDGTTPSSPITEEYKPTKGRKKAEKERQREIKERKREQARAKSKPSSTKSTSSPGKGKQKADLVSTETEDDIDSDDGPDDADADELPVITQRQAEEDEVTPEKLKIKLKLTLNSASNPSSANISESENTGVAGNSTPQKTGLKLRLPPSRSLSVTPSASNVSTPPTSHASIATSSSSSLSESGQSTATLPTTATTTATTASAQPTSPSSASTTLPSAEPSTSTSTSVSAADAEATAKDYASTLAHLPHAHPPTHTSAPHLTSDISYIYSQNHHASSSTSSSSYPSSSSHPINPNVIGGGIPQRANRSPKRTFDESELGVDDTGAGGIGNGGRSSRLRRGPEQFEGTVWNENKDDVVMNSPSTGVGSRIGLREGTVEPERDSEVEEREVAETLVEGRDGVPTPPPPDQPTTTTTKITPPTTQETELAEDESDTGAGSSSSLSSLSPEHEPEHEDLVNGGNTPTTSPSPPSTATTATTAITATNNKPKPPPSPPTATITHVRRSSPPLTRKQKQTRDKLDAEMNAPRMTRRQRKLLGLPKGRKVGVGPYERKSTRAGGADGGVEEGEWKRNGTGRVDVRGFRELKI